MSMSLRQSLPILRVLPPTPATPSGYYSISSPPLQIVCAPSKRAAAAASAPRPHEGILAPHVIAHDQAVLRHGCAAEGAGGDLALQVKAHAAVAQLRVPAVELLTVRKLRCATEWRKSRARDRQGKFRCEAEGPTEGCQRVKMRDRCNCLDLGSTPLYGRMSHHHHIPHPEQLPYHAKRTWRGADRHRTHSRSAISTAGAARGQWASTSASILCLAIVMAMRRSRLRLTRAMPTL
jgi:hypothetical protein